MKNPDKLLSDLKYLLALAMERHDADSIPDDLSFGDWPEWDSLTHVSFLIGINGRFGVMPTPEEIPYTTSLSKLVMFLRTCFNEERNLSITKQRTCEWGDIFNKLSQDIKVGDNSCIYVHSRMSSLMNNEIGGMDKLVSILQGKDAGRTLVFPAFPFTSKSYSHYINNRAQFSVKNSIVLTGLLPEYVLKSERPVYRSAHPLLSDMAVGPKAEWVISAAHLAPDPFHRDSSYMRLINDDALMIGIGLDINTNAFIHYVDDHYRERYPFDIYMPEPLEFKIEHVDGRLETRSYLAYSPDMTRRIKPRNLRPYFSSAPEIVREVSYKGISFFVIRIRPFLERCMEIAENALRNAQIPPWFVNVDEKGS